LVALGHDRRQSIGSPTSPSPIVYPENAMTLCPIAVLASCAQCPAVSFCPLKTVLGDAKPQDSEADKTKANPADAKS